MLKGLFFGAPSVSVCNTLYPVVEELALCGYKLIAYNLENFPPPSPRKYSFRKYPPYKNGYHPACMDEHTSYLEFGEILIDTTNSLVSYLVEEVRKEKPDFILHSHLAVWGRLVAEHFKIPSITLFTTFILEKKIMLSFFGKNTSKGNEALQHIRNTIRFNKKLKELYWRLQLTGEPDIWDIYVNRKGLNLSFIPECFQPQLPSLGAGYKFLGHTTALTTGQLQKSVIYVSMGTILNRNEPFYRLCLSVLKKLDHPSVLVVGNTINISTLGIIPGHIKVVAFAEQAKILPEALLFITRGGMASVQESLHSQTPMIVIPEMAEQQITAEIIEMLGIGIHLPPAVVSEHLLLRSISRLLKNHKRYTEKIREVLANSPKEKAERAATKLITSFLESRNVFA